MSNSSTRKLALHLGALLLVTCSAAWATSPIDYEDEARKAKERQKQGGEIDPGLLDGGDSSSSNGSGGGNDNKCLQDPPPDYCTGCIPRNAGKKMSLLGVEYDTGNSPQMPKGSLGRLAQADPALKNLNAQQKKLDDVNDQERRDLSSQGFGPIGGWKGAVNGAQSDLDDADREMSARRKIVSDIESEKSKYIDDGPKWKERFFIESKGMGVYENEPDSATRDRKVHEFVEETYSKDIANFDEKISKARARVEEYQGKLGAAGDKLDKAQRGLAKHDQALVPASAARDAANKMALEEAAKCD